jgi:predicted dehydrogenase
MTLGIGLLGAASISKKSWGAMHRAGHRVVHIGCRDVTRGAVFAKECADDLEIPEENRPAVGSYEDTISHPDVEAVYIPLPVTQREKWVLMCAEKGKHVVGEKPPARCAGELKEWLAALHAKGLLYMDGTMLSHGKRISEMTTHAKSLGAMTHMHASFAFNGGDDILGDIRADVGLEPMGALGDLGWYCTRYMLHFTNFTLPTRVSGRYKKRTESGAILSFVADMEFPGGLTSSFHVSFGSAFEQTFTASFEDGVIRVDDFTLPFEGTSLSYTVSTHTIIPEGTKLPVIKRSETKSVNEDSTFQETQLWRDLEAALEDRAGTEGGVATSRVAKNEDQQKWADMSFKTQLILDALVDSANQHGKFIQLPAQIV